MFKEALDNLDIFEKELKKRKTPFFSGIEPGMIDYMIWPWCERSDLIKILRGDQYVLPKDRFAKFVSFLFFFFI